MAPKKLGFGLMRLPLLNPEDDGSIGLDVLRRQERGGGL